MNPEELAQIRQRFTAMGGEGNNVPGLYRTIAGVAAQHDEVLALFDRLPDAKRRPVLLLAAVHYLVLRGARHELVTIYDAPDARGATAAAGRAFVAFCVEHEAELRELMRDRAVQTNEVNRCVGLLPALMEAARVSRRSLALVELGASAGLNLLFDRYRYDYAGGPVVGPPGATVRLHTTLRGRVPRLDPAMPVVDHRVGLDLDPLDITDDDEVLWLRSCIWVGDVARDQRLSAAVDLARREWPDVRRGDALHDLADLVDGVPDDLELCIFSSWMLGWMTAADCDAVAAVIDDIARRRPLWWITFEDHAKVPGLPAVNDEPGDSSVLGLQHLGGGEPDRRVLATMHHHGAWLDWVDAPSAAW